MYTHKTSNITLSPVCYYTAFLTHRLQSSSSVCLFVLLSFRPSSDVDECCFLSVSIEQGTLGLNSSLICFYWTPHTPVWGFVHLLAITATCCPFRQSDLERVTGALQGYSCCLYQSHFLFVYLHMFSPPPYSVHESVCSENATCSSILQRSILSVGPLQQRPASLSLPMHTHTHRMKTVTHDSMCLLNTLPGQHFLWFEVFYTHTHTHTVFGFSFSSSFYPELHSFSLPLSSPVRCTATDSSDQVTKIAKLFSSGCI